jgi:hypothetical protein
VDALLCVAKGLKSSPSLLVDHFGALERDIDQKIMFEDMQRSQYVLSLVLGAAVSH